MSYCRWSSDDFQCDLYCYADVSGGYTTHVAGNKSVGEIPKTDWVGFMNKTISAEEFAEQHSKQYEWLDKCERKPLGLPCDGESFNDATAELWLKRLMELRAMGYRFPDHVIDDAKAEMEEEAKSGKA